jgi:hypothetical protein
VASQDNSNGNSNGNSSIDPNPDPKRDPAASTAQIEDITRQALTTTARRADATASTPPPAGPRKGRRVVPSDPRLIRIVARAARGHWPAPQRYFPTGRIAEIREQ